jgi:hypothetical protein
MPPFDTGQRHRRDLSRRVENHRKIARLARKHHTSTRFAADRDVVPPVGQIDGRNQIAPFAQEHRTIAPARRLHSAGKH